MKKFLECSNDIDRSSYIWNMAGSMLNAFQSVIFLMILTRVVGLTEAGVFTIAYADANLFLNIGKFGMRYFQVSDVKQQYSFTAYKRSRYISTLLMFIVSLIFLLYTANLNGYSMHKSLVIMWMCLFKMVDSIEDVFHGRLQQEGRLDIASKMLTLRTSSTILVWTAVLIITDDQMWATAIGTIYTCLCFLWMMWLVSDCLHPGTVETLEWTGISADRAGQYCNSVGSLLRVTFPLFISTFLSFYIGNAQKYAIDAELSDQMQACYGFIAMPVFVVGLLNNFIFNPMITELSFMWGERDIRGFIKRSFVQMGIVFVITALCLAGGWLIGIPVLSWIYSTDLTPYKADLLILLLGGGYLGLSGLLQTLITIIRMQRYLAFGYGIIALLALLLSNPVVRVYEIRGAAVLYLILMAVLSVAFLGLFLWGVRKKSPQTEKEEAYQGSKNVQ